MNTAVANTAAVVRIAKGMRATYKNCVEFPLEEALIQIAKRTNCFEVLNDDINRCYVDVDGKLNTNTTEEQYNDLYKRTLDALQFQFGPLPHSMMDASKFIARKISFRVVVTNATCTKAQNRAFVEQCREIVGLPAGIDFDTGVYDAHRKMRMLGSNKDEENRPLILLHGEPIDTLISYIPEGCKLMSIVVPEKSKRASAVTVKVDEVSSKKVSDILKNLNASRADNYESWVKVGIILFNEGHPLSVWIEWSKTSASYEEDACDDKWKTFRKGDLTIGTLWKMLKEDNPDAYARLYLGSYEEVKTRVEKTYFKLLSPACFGKFENGKLELLKKEEFKMIHENVFYGVKEIPFYKTWVTDVNIRTYKALVFKPMQDVGADYFNLFQGFPTEAIKGDISVVQGVLKLVTGNDPAMFEYLENYMAHMIQKPYEIPGKAIVVSGEQGVGKETYFNFIGEMLGKYYHNSIAPHEDVFGRFNGHTQQTIFMKMEEVELETNRANQSMLKGLITAKSRSFEDKGQKAIVLDSFLRIVMTTNKDVPVVVDDKERRLVLIRASSDRRQDVEYWNGVYKVLDTQEAKCAYFHHLLNKDISNFDVNRDRVLSDYYHEVKQAQTPYHAKFFQKIIEKSEDEGNSDVTIDIAHNPTMTWKSRELLTAINKDSKYPMTEHQIGKAMKLYETVIIKKKTKFCNEYTTKLVELQEFLVSKGWWQDY